MDSLFSPMGRGARLIYGALIPQLRMPEDKPRPPPEVAQEKGMPYDLIDFNIIRDELYQFLTQVFMDDYSVFTVVQGEEQVVIRTLDEVNSEAHNLLTAEGFMPHKEDRGEGMPASLGVEIKGRPYYLQVIPEKLRETRGATRHLLRIPYAAPRRWRRLWEIGPEFC